MHALCLLSLFEAETFDLFKLALSSPSCSLSLPSAELRVWTTSLAHFSFLTNLMGWRSMCQNHLKSGTGIVLAIPTWLRHTVGVDLLWRKPRSPLDLPSPLVLSSWFIIHKIKELFYLHAILMSQGQWSVIPSAYSSKSWHKKATLPCHCLPAPISRRTVHQLDSQWFWKQRRTGLLVLCPLMQEKEDHVSRGGWGTLEVWYSMGLSSQCEWDVETVASMLRQFLKTKSFTSSLI